MDSGQRRYLLRGSEKCGQQRRSKRSPSVIRSLVLLANRVSVATQIPNHPSRHSHRGDVSLKRKRNSRKRRPRGPHKRHQRMHRRYNCSPLAQAGQFITAQGAAGVNCNSSLPFDSALDRPCRARNLNVRHTKPNQLSPHSGQVDRRTSPQLLCQPSRFLQRSSERTRNHRLNRIPRVLQRQPERSPQIPRPHNRDSWLYGHARQHSRTLGT